MSLVNYVRCLVIALTLIAGTLPRRAYANEENLNQEAARLYQQVMSPFCPGRSLNDCPSSKAHELKDQMKQKLASGVAPDVILEEVFAAYGEQYRAVPRNEGFGRLVWIAPVGFLVLGGVIWLLVGMSRNRSVVVVSSASKLEVSDAVRRQIADELAKID